jgi:hypothetical protein
LTLQIWRLKKKIAASNLISTVNPPVSQKILNASYENSPISQKNLPLIENTLTPDEKALLIRAKKFLLIDRLAADHKRAITDKELLSVETEINQGFITDFDLQLLSFEKFYHFCT